MRIAAWDQSLGSASGAKAKGSCVTFEVRVAGGETRFLSGFVCYIGCIPCLGIIEALI